MWKTWSAWKAAACFITCALCALFAVLLRCSPAFEAGEGYEIYSGASSSSPVRIAGDVFTEKLGGAVAGESVRFSGNRLEELRSQYRAHLLFTEKAGDVTNYYFYSPVLQGGILLNGHYVNLHIAVSEERTVAGTPIIFGGY